MIVDGRKNKISENRMMFWDGNENECMWRDDVGKFVISWMEKQYH